MFHIFFLQNNCINKTKEYFQRKAAGININYSIYSGSFNCMYITFILHIQ